MEDHSLKYLHDGLLDVEKKDWVDLIPYNSDDRGTVPSFTIISYRHLKSDPDQAYAYYPEFDIDNPKEVVIGPDEHNWYDIILSESFDSEKVINKISQILKRDILIVRRNNS